MSLTFDPNTLYFKMVKYFSDHKNDQDRVIFCNEGGSRSSKTWDFYHFIVTYCDHNRNGNKDIYILRDTLVNCRDFTLKEFEKCMQVIGIPLDSLVKTPKPYFNLWGNHIYFRGLDDEKNTEGFPSHIAFINEGLEVESQSQIAGILMRCEEVFAMDWNPKFTDHWAFGFEKRNNCLFTHSTYKNNKHLPQSIINDIEGYNPYHPEDLDKPKKQRRPHPVNVEAGTSDEYRYEVYALGLRAARKGLIFPDVTWIREFPDHVEKIAYGMDFGYTNDPTAIVKAGVHGNDLFLELLLYEPTENIDILEPLYSNLIGKKDRCWCDSENPAMISDLRKAGHLALGVRKFKGSIVYGIDLIKRYKIHIVVSNEARKEQENYSWKMFNGFNLNVPIDKHNHFWDASRYVCLSEFR